MTYLTRTLAAVALLGALAACDLNEDDMMSDDAMMTEDAAMTGETMMHDGM